jgi:hypothetical protein
MALVSLPLVTSTLLTVALPVSTTELVSWPDSVDVIVPVTTEAEDPDTVPLPSVSDELDEAVSRSVTVADALTVSVGVEVQV